MRVEITYPHGRREYVIQGEVNTKSGEVELLNAWDMIEGRGGFDLLDLIESNPRDLDFVKAALRHMAGFRYGDSE